MPNSSIGPPDGPLEQLQAEVVAARRVQEAAREALVKAERLYRACYFLGTGWLMRMGMNQAEAERRVQSWQ
jgi:hypothetical protein